MLALNDYNGDITTLQVDYLYFLIKDRPDLISFLALPGGFRFFKDPEGSDIWRD